MNQQPSVSIVMPIYNGVKYLREAVDSILKQSFSDWELIFINDGSTDGTSTILSEYLALDSRLHLIDHEQNKGLAPSLNEGLRTARGKYVARMDQDDIALPDRLTIQFNFLERHPEIHLVGGGYAAFNEHGHRVSIFHPSSSLRLAWSIITDNRFCHPTVMFRKSVIDDVGLYPTTGAEDFAFFSKIALQFRCHNLHTILIKYREHPSNMSTTTKPAIVASARETFQTNYLHYIGNVNGAESFYQYQTKNILYFRNAIAIFRNNAQILKRARSQYRMRYWDLESLGLNIYLLNKNIRSVAGTQARRLATFMKHS